MYASSENLPATWKRGSAAIWCDDLRARHAEMQVLALFLDHALAHELLQDLEPHVGIVEHRRIERALGALQVLLLIAQRLREFGLGDAAALVGRHHVGGGIAAAEVVVDAEEGERKRDQREDDLRDALVLVEKIVHASGLASERRRGPRAPRAAHQSKRANLRSPLRSMAEWTGLEPATPGVTGRYSNQLNYHSKIDPRPAIGNCVGAHGGC